MAHDHVQLQTSVLAVLRLQLLSPQCSEMFDIRLEYDFLNVRQCTTKDPL
jgi:hypothetical protein